MAKPPSPSVYRGHKTGAAQGYGGHRGAKEDRPEFWAQSSQSSAPPERLAFVESSWFQGIIGFVIFCNAIMIGAELEIEFEGWAVIEFLVLVFFTAELCLRCCHHGWSFFDNAGNLFDMLIVVSGVIDSWIIPLFTWLFGGRQQKHHSGVLSTVAQTLRIGRIVRLIRLVKIIKPLYRLALGIAEALQGMFWVLVFLVMMLYAAAILCTRLLGHAEVSSLFDPQEEPAATAVREMFHSVSSSMFVLFEMMSCWSLMKFTPIFRLLPLLRLLAVLFYILMAWALLAVMTGVVSEKMIAVKDALTSEEKDRDQVRRQIAGEKLRDLFTRVDKDGSGTITREEFNSMLLCTDLSKLLMEYAQTNTEELTEVFDWLDHDGNGHVDIAEFIWGFNWLNEQVSPKSFLKFQEDASKSIRQLHKSLLAFVHERFDALVASVEAPLRKLKVVSKQVAHLEVLIRKVEAELQNLPDTAPCFQSESGDFCVDQLESMLEQRVESLLLLVGQLEEEDRRLRPRTAS